MVIPYDNLAGASNNLDRPFHERVAGAARDAVCGVYRSTPGQLFRGIGGNTPAGSLARGFLDDMCAPFGGGTSGGGGAGRSWDQLPPPPINAQCPTRYLFDCGYKIYFSFPTGDCLQQDVTAPNRAVFGPIEKIRYFDSGTPTAPRCQSVNAFKRIQVLCHGTNSYQAIPDWVDVVFDVEHRIVDGSFRFINLRRADGQPDNCGIMPFPEEEDDDPDPIILPPININIRPTVNINLPITINPTLNVNVGPFVFAPVIPVIVGGIQLNFGVGGVDISPSPRPIPTPEPTPLPQPIIDTINNIDNRVTNLIEIINDIDCDLSPVLRAIDDLDSMIRGRFRSVSNALDCIEQLVRASACCNEIKPEESQQVLIEDVAEYPQEVYVLSLGAVGRAFILLEILEPIPPTLRVFHLDADATNIEAGFGNVSLGYEFNDVDKWVRPQIHHVFSRYTIIEIPNDGMIYSLRLSIKGGVFFRVIDPGLRWVPKQMPDCLEVVQM